MNRKNKLYTIPQQVTKPKKQVDALELAWLQLRNRRFDAKGNWVGFDGYLKGIAAND